jgi:hypothetical protein
VCGFAYGRKTGVISDSFLEMKKEITVPLNPEEKKE